MVFLFYFYFLLKLDSAQHHTQTWWWCKSLCFSQSIVRNQWKYLIFLIEAMEVTGAMDYFLWRYATLVPSLVPCTLFMTYQWYYFWMLLVQDTFDTSSNWSKREVNLVGCKIFVRLITSLRTQCLACNKNLTIIMIRHNF